MSLIRRKVEHRSVTYQDVWGAGVTPSSNSLRASSVSGALALAAVYAATGLIADLVSTSPLAAYNESPGGIRVLRPKQPQLVVNPDPYGGSIVDWLHQGLTSCLLTGNSFGYVLKVDSQAVPSQVAWLNPAAVSVVEAESYQIGVKARYYWNGRPLDPDLLIHVRGYTFPGSTLAFSPLGLFKAQIETGLAAQQFSRDWFENGAAPSGHMKNTAQTLDETESDTLKKRFKAATRNRDVLITGNDWDWTALGVPADQAKFLETIAATATQIAAIYRVSPEDVGGTSGSGTSLTYKTLLQDQQRLNQRALRPWARRFEEVFTNLLTRPVYARFNLDVNAQGTVLERMQAHAAAMSTGMETQDEGRTSEDRAPLDAEQKAAWLEYLGKAAPVAPADPTIEGQK